MCYDWSYYKLDEKFVYFYYDFYRILNISLYITDYKYLSTYQIAEFILNEIYSDVLQKRKQKAQSETISMIIVMSIITNNTAS